MSSEAKSVQPFNLLILFAANLKLIDCRISEVAIHIFLKKELLMALLNKSISTSKCNIPPGCNSMLNERIQEQELNEPKYDQGKINRRNQRERNRVKLLNMGFERLRAVVPCKEGEQLSKIATLRSAIWYIEHLAKILDLPESNEPAYPNIVKSEPNIELHERIGCSTVNEPKIGGKKKSSRQKEQRKRSKVDSNSGLNLDSGLDDKENARPKRTASPVFPGGWTDPADSSPIRNICPNNQLNVNTSLTNSSKSSYDSGFLSWDGNSPLRMENNMRNSFYDKSDSSGYNSLQSPLNLSQMMNVSQTSTMQTSNYPASNGIYGFPWLFDPNSLMHTVLYGGEQNMGKQLSTYLQRNRHILR